jgi:antitoxin (DNA-binding transcriptional repressor) of toxin-antitoxin stability system
MPMSTMTVQIDTAKLSDLLRRVEAGEQIVLEFQGVPIVRLVPETITKPERKFGRLKGKVALDETFFDPLPEEELEAWGQ